jgi:hypothetical protein
VILNLPVAHQTMLLEPPLVASETERACGAMARVDDGVGGFGGRFYGPPVAGRGSALMLTSRPVTCARLADHDGPHSTKPRRELFRRRWWARQWAGPDPTPPAARQPSRKAGWPLN